MSKPTVDMLICMISTVLGRGGEDDEVALFACRRAGFIDRAGRLTPDGFIRVRDYVEATR